MSLRCFSSAIRLARIWQSATTKLRDLLCFHRLSRQPNYSFKGNADVSDFQTIIQRRVPLTQALGRCSALRCLHFASVRETSPSRTSRLPGNSTCFVLGTRRVTRRHLRFASYGQCRIISQAGRGRGITQLTPRRLSNYSFKGNADVFDFQTIIRRRVPLIQALDAIIFRSDCFTSAVSAHRVSRSETGCGFAICLQPLSADHRGQRTFRPLPSGQVASAWPQRQLRSHCPATSQFRSASTSGMLANR